MSGPSVNSRSRINRNSRSWTRRSRTDAFVAEVDLPFLILTQLRAATRRLEEEVHVLAWNYHWAESDILAMSRPKRARYVRLIEEQLDRFSTV